MRKYVSGNNEYFKGSILLTFQDAEEAVKLMTDAVKMAQILANSFSIMKL